MENEKILIVEDNKALSKLMAKKISKHTGFEVDIANDLKEAQALLIDEEYFVALLDLNLPDAPDGEVVDYMLSKKIPSIVLTGNIETKTRDEIMSKDVIDYVYKGNMDDVNYIFNLIDRLAKNRKYKVMIVDDSIVMRNEVKKMLKEQMYEVFSAAHGEEALSYLNDNQDIKLILTDYNMPVIDGFELTKQVREKFAKTELSIIAMTAASDDKISSKFLKVGANDFINKPFTKEELVCRVNNSIESLEYIETISNMANTDFMTGAYNRRHFFIEAEAYFVEAKKRNETFAIAMLDLDKFKNINDTYGHDVGDLVIVEFAHLLKDNTKGFDIVSRFGGEEFCVLLKDVDKEEAVEFFVRLCFKVSQAYVTSNGKKIGFTSSIGVAFCDEDDLIEMINHADMALYNAKKNGRNRVEIA